MKEYGRRCKKMEEDEKCWKKIKEDGIIWDKMEPEDQYEADEEN